MSTTSLLVSVSSLLGVASAAEWTIDTSTAAQQIIGVGAWNEQNDIAAASANGVGGFMERWDGGSWSKESLGDATAGLLMDAATSDKVSVGVSMLPVVLSTDGGKTYETCSTLSGLSQNANVFPPDSGDHIGLVGSFTTAKGEPFTSGVAHSSDLGSSWTVSEVPGGYVRYGAFPSAETWYVTAGMWGSDAVRAKEDGRFELSSRLSVVQDQQRVHFQNVSSSEDSSGWFGRIWKTTDAGASWAEVFSSSPADMYYFNNIACASEDVCVAVTEGDSLGDFRAYWTEDGGATWVDTLPAAEKPDNQVSLMGAGWFSAQEGWLAGTAKSGRDLIGLFFQTVDGGKTYTLQQELDNCFPIDMDMTKADGHLGLTACISSSGTSAAIATLN